jgi:predicted nucleic acid-binding protein
MTAYLVDTNLLLRSLDPSTPQGSQALAAIKHLLAQGDELYTTPQILYEFWSVCTRPPGTAPQGENGLGMSVAQTQAEISRLQALLPLREDNDQIFAQWLRLVSTHAVTGRRVHDTRLVAAMLVHGITHLLTFNGPDFSRYPEITIMAPRDVVP